MNYNSAPQEIQSMIDGIISVEKGYVNNKYDNGGETKYGITEAVARKNGYTGSMIDLPLSLAQNIYINDYFYNCKLDKIYEVDKEIGIKVTDAGVNIGTNLSVRLLQRSINILNGYLSHNKNIAADGIVGVQTIQSLSTYLENRNSVDESREVFLKMYNVLQGYHYYDISVKKPTNKTFIYGWLNKRVNL